MFIVGFLAFSCIESDKNNTMRNKNVVNIREVQDSNKSISVKATKTISGNEHIKSDKNKSKDKILSEMEYNEIMAIIDSTTKLIETHSQDGQSNAFEIGMKYLKQNKLVDSIWIEENTLIVRFKNGFSNFWTFN